MMKYSFMFQNKTMFPEEQEQVLIKAFTSEGNDLDSMQEAANKLISCLQIIESLDSCMIIFNRIIHCSVNMIQSSS